MIFIEWKLVAAPFEVRQPMDLSPIGSWAQAGERPKLANEMGLVEIAGAVSDLREAAPFTIVFEQSDHSIEANDPSIGFGAHADLGAEPALEPLAADADFR